MSEVKLLLKIADLLKIDMKSINATVAFRILYFQVSMQ